MNRLRLNFVVDYLALSLGVLLGSSGFLLYFRLPPGTGGLGTGRGALQKPIFEIWGLTRHQWGEIHLILALCLMAVIALHLALHLRWVTACLSKEGALTGRPYRLALWLLPAAILIVLAAAPWLSPRRDRHVFTEINPPQIKGGPHEIKR